MIDDVRDNLRPLIQKYMAIRRVRREQLHKLTNTVPIDDVHDFMVLNCFLEAGIVARQCIRACKAVRDFKGFKND